jgi:predicted amidohydrolase
MNIRSREVAAELAEAIPGPTTDTFAGLARQYQVYLVLGMAEYDPATGRCYNAQVVIGPDGRIIGRYRKIHLFGPDLNWAETGDLGYQAVDTGYGRIGLGICCDINYWELMNFLSASRVEMFAFSTNWVGDDLPFPYWTEMVAGGGYYVIAANNWGNEGELHFSGGSAILAPDASVIARSGPSGNDIIYGMVTLGRQDAVS